MRYGLVTVVWTAFVSEAHAMQSAIVLTRERNSNDLVL